jgi:hypothetical protein
VLPSQTEAQRIKIVLAISDQIEGKRPQSNDARWFCLIGLIKEPTDEAFNQAVAETRNKNKNNELKNITETH